MSIIECLNLLSFMILCLKKVLAVILQILNENKPVDEYHISLLVLSFTFGICELLSND